VLNLFKLSITLVLLLSLDANARTCVENIIGVEPTKLILENPELVEEILARRTIVKGLHFRIPEYAPLIVQMIQELENVPGRLAKVQGHTIKKGWLNMRARGFKAQLEQALPSLTYYQSIEFSFEFAWFFMKLLYLEEGDELIDVYTNSNPEKYISAPLDYALSLRSTLKIAQKSKVLVVPATRMVSIPEINRLRDYNAATLGALAYPIVFKDEKGKIFKDGSIQFILHDASHLISYARAIEKHPKINAKLSVKAAKLIYPQLDSHSLEDRWNYKDKTVSREEIENAIFRLRHEGNRITKSSVDYFGTFEKYKIRLLESLWSDVLVSDNVDKPRTTLLAVEWVLDHWEQIWE